MIDLNLICSVAESWCDQLSICFYLQEEQQGCLRSVLATLVFISTITESPHVLSREYRMCMQPVSKPYIQKVLEFCICQNLGSLRQW
jgi:hypothetical protein